MTNLTVMAWDCSHSFRLHKAKGLCGPCYNRRHLDLNPAQKVRTQKYMRTWILHKKFGIDDAEYERLLKLQSGLCKICGEGPNGRWSRLQVDHDHKTGNIRGLLCWNCNYRIVGKLESKPDMLSNLIYYLDSKADIGCN